MYNNLLTQWRLVSEDDVQHGYIPGRGVVTAWEALLKNLKEPNIVMVDFKGFFDNVAHNAINLTLMQMGMPRDEVSFISAINKSKPKLPTEVRIPETEYSHHMLDMEYFMNGARFTREKYVPRWIPINGKWVRNPEAPPRDKLLKTELFKFRGVPQGAPTSCSLATLVLRHISAEVRSVIYADDGAYFPKDIEHCLERMNRPELGIRPNPDKIEILKKDGV